MLLVPPAWTNDAKGQFFEAITADLLKRQRFSVQKRIRFTGMELDLLATHKETRQRAFIECKFTQDVLSANVIDNLIGKSIRRNADLAYLFSTAPPGKEAQGILEEMAQAPPVKFPHFAFVGPEKLIDMFHEIYSIAQVSPSEVFDAATLIISPKLPPFWALEKDVKDLLAPLRIQAILPDTALPISDIQQLFENVKLFSGRDLEVEAQGIIAKDHSRQLILRRSGSIRHEALDALNKFGSKDE